MERMDFTAKTLDEAITKACIELGVVSDELDYIVKEQGSNGVLGFGARPWVISAMAKGKEEEVKEEPKCEEAPKKETKAPAKEEVKPAPKKEAPVKPAKEEKAEVKNEAPVKEATQESKELTPAEIKAKDFLNGVFESMGMKVVITTKYDRVLNELDVDIEGDDMGVLIGKRGQTLDSLQYLTGQVVNKNVSGYIRVKLDTENYRERRKETLEKLAHNMAHKVRRAKHPMALEPMNPYERRIIHSSLQDEKDIITRSEGEEPYRHVVVCYVKKK
ncbi:MAG: RNA-binding cell elongation regulator Jag/EloR [Eubacteriales bacterium]|nr:RNA-binding cell elongation regulator Jag/EloR [Eubacteriales bacterium]